MSANEPVWSYGTVKLYKSSGVAGNVDDIWSYGQSVILHEWVDLPVVTDMGDESFTNIETGVKITGTDFLAAQGNGKVELADSSTYATANLKELTINSWADTEINVDISVLPTDDVWVGTLYTFVTTNASLQSSGYQITVVEYAAPTEGQFYTDRETTFSKGETKDFYIKQ